MSEQIDMIARECLGARLRMLNRLVTGVFDDAIRPLGIKFSQLNILVVVGKRGPVESVAVGRILRLEKSTLSRNLERIRKRGWIEVRTGSSARQHVLELTTRGKRLVERAAPLWEAAQKNVIEILGERGAGTIRGAADRVWSKDPSA